MAQGDPFGNPCSFNRLAGVGYALLFLAKVRGLRLVLVLVLLVLLRTGFFLGAMLTRAQDNQSLLHLPNAV